MMSLRARLASALAAFGRDETGATAIEYGLIAAILAIGCIAAFTALGTALGNLFAFGVNSPGSLIQQAADNIAN